MKKILFIFSLLLLASCGQFLDENPKKIKKIPDIVVLPHHGITAKNIDNFYKNLAQNGEKYERIIIISPDHFAKLSYSIESHPKNLQTACFQNFCVPLKNFENYHFEHSKIFRENGKIFEHGLGEHFVRIAKNFPNIPVTPLVVRRAENIGIHDDTLSEKITKLAKTEKILLVLSVDFSHHVREDIAIFHDELSEQTLDIGEKSDFSLLEVDCRNCLYIGKTVANNFGKNHFQKSLRTSVDTITEKFSDTENTSHIFGAFEKGQNGEKKQFILFVNGKNFTNPPFIQHLYQEKNLQKSPQIALHHIGTGWNRIFIGHFNAEKIRNILVKNNFSPLTETTIFDWQVFFDEKTNILHIKKSDENIESKHFDLQENILACEFSTNTFECKNISL